MRNILNIIWAAILAFVVALIPIAFIRGREQGEYEYEADEAKESADFHRKIAEHAELVLHKRNSSTLPDRLREHGL